MAILDIIVFINARENVFHPCKIGRALYGVRLISYNAVRAPGRLTNSPVILQIAEIVRCQFYL